LIGEEIGQGGMGTVFLARHERLNRKAAVKVLKAELVRDPEILRRFLNEGRAATLIEHPGIVEVYDVGQTEDGFAYILMEFLSGQTLADRLLREGRIPSPMAASIGWQIASALGAAHYKGIVHRDLKPANVFLCPDYAVTIGWRVKVLDFGIAKLTQHQGDEKTLTHSVFGTPTYMSPEQLRSAAKVDHRSDIYSLGCIMYEMVTGRPPFEGEGIGSIVAGHMSETPVAPHTLEPSVTPLLENAILKALAKDREERHESMVELAEELSAVSEATGEHVSAELPGLARGAIEPATARKAPSTTFSSLSGEVVSGRRSRASWIAGLSAAVVLGVVAFFVLRPGSPEPPALPSLSSSVKSPPPAPVRPAAVKLVIRTVPPTAEIVLNGGTLPNPFEGRFDRGGVTRELVVSAPGYEKEVRWLSFETDQVVEVKLKKPQAPAEFQPAAAEIEPQPGPKSKPAPVASKPAPAKPAKRARPTTGTGSNNVPIVD
jgi:eukaryotic-like serine/threonine-protein kinase